MSRAACAIAEDTEASAIFAITKSGRTARLLSKYRIQTPIFAFTGARSVVRNLPLSGGVNGVLLEGMTDTDSSLKMVTDLSLRMGYAKEGENVVFVAGIPLLQTNKVNMIKVEEL
jgi:pyruvate kinase